MLQRFIYLSIYQRWISIITRNCLMRNVIRQYILYSCVEYIDFFIHIAIFKTSNGVGR